MKLEILNNVPLSKGRYLLELSFGPGIGSAVPGQFLHVRIEDSCDPLLRRPFSIHDVAPGGRRGAGIVKVLYEVKGKGTRLLSEKRPSGAVDVLGPLGRGFDLKKIQEPERVVVAAGGMGVAPLFFLAKKIAHKKPEVLLGFKTKAQILCEKELKGLGCKVRIATEDGSKGFKGKATDLLNEVLSSGAAGPAAICACGPKPMLAQVAETARSRNCEAFVSLEEFMGCGLGACLGCVVRTTTGYRRICHDGPVFDAQEILWKE